MLVYIVMAGEYSDRGVDAVFTDEKLAKAHLYIAQKKDPDEIYDIEVYETADDNVAFLKKDVEDAMDAIKFGYNFTLKVTDGSVDYKPSYEYMGNWYGQCLEGRISYNGVYFSMFVIAKNPSEEEYERCLKIARDKLAKAKAEKEGL